MNNIYQSEIWKRFPLARGGTAFKSIFSQVEFSTKILLLSFLLSFVFTNQSFASNTEENNINCETTRNNGQTFARTTTNTYVPPVITCPGNIGPLENSTGSCGVIHTITGQTSTSAVRIRKELFYFDNNGTNVEFAPGSSAFFPIGETEVTYEVTDRNNEVAKCTFKVTVEDRELPTITNCPGDVVVELSKQITTPCLGTCEGYFDPFVHTKDVVLNDNCPGVKQVCRFRKKGNPTWSDSFSAADPTDPTEFCLAVGIYEFQHWAIDASLNESEAASICEYEVTIKDDIKPTITCPADITKDVDTGECYATIAIKDPVVADNCEIDQITYSIYNEAGQPVFGGSGAFPVGTGTSSSIGDFQFPFGENTIYYWVIDENGNKSEELISSPMSATCATKVIVEDPAIPTPTTTDLAVYPGECRGATNYAIQNNNEHVWYKLIAPLTGKIIVDATASVNLILCAYEAGCVPGTVHLLETIDLNSPTAQLKLEGLDPCQAVFIEVKSYHFTPGITFDICAYEPPLLCSDWLTDSNAGENGKYKDNESIATVICPFSEEVSFVKLAFNDFKLQARDPITGECLDYLEIRDGDSPDAPAISVNGKTRFCGEELKNEEVFATNWPNGCLTVLFHSNDDGIVADGWNAKVDCDDCNLDFETEISACDIGEYNLTINATGGHGRYEYSRDRRNWQTSNLFLNVSGAPGSDIRIYVRDPDNHLCSIRKLVKLEGDPLRLPVYQLINTDCDGKNGAVILKVTGGAKPYKFDIVGDDMSGGALTVEDLGDDLYQISNLTLDIDPASGRPIPEVFGYGVEDKYGCKNYETFYLEVNCERIDCERPSLPSHLKPFANQEAVYFCSNDGTSNLVVEALEIFSIGGPDTTLQIFEGQGTTGTLLAEFSAANPPTGLPIYSGTPCITVNMTGISTTRNDGYKIRVNCADCDFSVKVETVNESCFRDDGKVILTIDGDSHYKVTLENAIPKQVWDDVSGNTPLVIENLKRSVFVPWRFTIEEKWFHCKETVRAKVGRDAAVSIEDYEVTNETCAGNDATVVVAVKGGSGEYEYSINGGINFFPANAVESVLSPQVDTFTITGLNGTGYYTPGSTIALVVRDARFSSGHYHGDDCATDSKNVPIGNDCFKKGCSGTFYDHPMDQHITDGKSMANYDRTKPFTAIICPDIPNQFTTVTFDFFETNTEDTLFVYDRNGLPADELDADTTLNAALAGDLSATVPIAVTATNPSGCLTFDFVIKSPNGSKRGWLGTIQCFGPCAMELETSPEVKKETCEYSKDGGLKISVVKGSGAYNYKLFRIINDAVVQLDAADLPEIAADTTPVLATGNAATDIIAFPNQTTGIFENLEKGIYIYVIDDKKFPNCRIVGQIEVARFPLIECKYKSPGLACDQQISTITLLPRGGSGRYKITPAGVEGDAKYINEGEEFKYDLIGVGNDIPFKISDAANELKCYKIVPIDITNNCKITCYDNEVFSSKRPYNGPIGYDNYEHFEITYCPHGADQRVKANFKIFETELDLDVLTIYHGKGITGDLLGLFSGNTSPGEIISTATDGCLTFVFEANIVKNDFKGFRADLTCVDCPLSADYDGITGETFCWDKVNGDKNGTLTVRVNDLDPLEKYRFKLFKVAKADGGSRGLSNFIRDNNSTHATFPDGDTRVGYFQFKGLQHDADSLYQVKVRIDGKPECTISLKPEEVEKIEELKVEVDVTNVNCKGEGGQVCFVATNGSGDYSYQIGGMTMTDPCFAGVNGNKISITIIDNVTGCSKDTFGTIGNDCHWTCDYDFFDDAGWDGYAGNADDGTALYAPNMDERWIFCPTAADKFIQIDFTAFKTEANIDSMTIIDGDGSGLLIGTYSGTNSPGLVRSTTGCLTVSFQSDEQVQKPGWAAKVSCFYCPKDFEITDAPDECVGHNGTINVSAVATGFSNFIYSLSSDFSDANSTGQFSGLSGTVTVYAKIIGLEACVKYLEIYEALDVSHTLTNENCSKGDGSITINATGGSGNYEFIVDNVSYGSNNVITGLSTGLYIAKVVDGTCVKEFAFNLTNIDDGPPVITYCPTDKEAYTIDRECHAFFDVKPLTATDCKPLTITNDYNGGGADATGYYPLGETTVTFTVSDGVDTSKCSFKVTVVDKEAPKFIQFSPAHPILADKKDGDIIIVDFGNIPLFAIDDIEFTDNCEVDKITFEDRDVQAGNKCADGGYYDEFDCVWTAIDKSGNEKAITITLKVKCPPVTPANLLPNFTFGSPTYSQGEVKTVIFNINEINNGDTDGLIRFFVPTPGGFTYDFDQNQTNVTVLFPESVNNPDWTVTETGTGLLFSSNTVIPAYGKSRVALKITAVIPGTEANLTVNIAPGSGGETNSDSDNNTAVLSQSIQNN